MRKRRRGRRRRLKTTFMSMAFKKMTILLPIEILRKRY